MLVAAAADAATRAAREGLRPFARFALQPHHVCVCVRGCRVSQIVRPGQQEPLRPRFSVTKKPEINIGTAQQHGGWDHHESLPAPEGRRYRRTLVPIERIKCYLFALALATVFMFAQDLSHFSLSLAAVISQQPAFDCVCCLH